MTTVSNTADAFTASVAWRAGRIHAVPASPVLHSLAILPKLPMLESSGVFGSRAMARATWNVKVDPSSGKVILVEPQVVRLDMPRGEVAKVTFSVEYFGTKIFNNPRVHIDDADGSPVHVGTDYSNESNGRQINHFSVDLTGYDDSVVLRVTQLAQPTLDPNPLLLNVLISETSDPYEPAQYVVTDLRPVIHVPPNKRGVLDVIIESVYYGDDHAELSFPTSGVFRAKGSDPEVPDVWFELIADDKVARFKYAGLSPDKNYAVTILKGNSPRIFTVSTKPNPRAK